MFRFILPLSAEEVAQYYSVRVPRLKQRRSATHWRGPCPVDGGKERFSVDPATGNWRCDSACGKAGSIVNLEMALTGTGFDAAYCAVCAIVERPTPAYLMISRETSQAGYGDRERMFRKQQNAALFVSAALRIPEEIRECISSRYLGRTGRSKLLADLRTDPVPLYDIFDNRYPNFTRALVRAVRTHNRRMQLLRAALSEELVESLKELVPEKSNAA